MRRVLCLFVVTWVVVVSARQLHTKLDDDDNDVYMGRVYRQCKDDHSKISCFKYRAMKFVKQATDDPTGSAEVWGPISIVKTAPTANPEEEPTKAELQPRAAESELDLMYKFANRQVDRYMSTHALAWNMGGSGEDEGVSVGRTAEKDVLGGRGKKKKGLRVLLPLVLLVKIKLIALVTLLVVVAIKKLIILAFIMGPILLTKLKLASLAHSEPPVVIGGGGPHQEHHHTSSVEYGHGGGEYGGGGAYPYSGWGNSYRRQGPVTYGSAEDKP